MGLRWVCAVMSPSLAFVVGACAAAVEHGDASSGEGTSADHGVTATSASGSTSGAPSSTSHDPGASDTDVGSGGPSFDCEAAGGIEVSDFELTFVIFRVLEEDVATAPVAPLCLLPAGDSWVIEAKWGELMAGETESSMRIRVPSGGTYDLSTDFGTPGSGTPSDASLSYARTVGPGTQSFDTANQAADGTLQVDGWPVEARDAIAIRADGNIAGADGWQFQFTLESQARR